MALGLLIQVSAVWQLLEKLIPTNPEYLAGVCDALVRGAGIHLTHRVAHAKGHTR
jgi:hypothetical protein